MARARYLFMSHDTNWHDCINLLYCFFRIPKDKNISLICSLHFCCRRQTFLFFFWFLTFFVMVNFLSNFLSQFWLKLCHQMIKTNYYLVNWSIFWPNCVARFFIFCSVCTFSCHFTEFYSSIIFRPGYIYWESVLFRSAILKWDYFSEFSDYYFFHYSSYKSVSQID